MLIHLTQEKQQSRLTVQQLILQSETLLLPEHGKQVMTDGVKVSGHTSLNDGKHSLYGGLENPFR